MKNQTMRVKQHNEKQKHYFPVNEIQSKREKFTVATERESLKEWKSVRSESVWFVRIMNCEMRESGDNASAGATCTFSADIIIVIIITKFIFIYLFI